MKITKSILKDLITEELIKEASKSEGSNPSKPGKRGPTMPDGSRASKEYDPAEDGPGSSRGGDLPQRRTQSLGNKKLLEKIIRLLQQLKGRM